LRCICTSISILPLPNSSHSRIAIAATIQAQELSHRHGQTQIQYMYTWRRLQFVGQIYLTLGGSYARLHRKHTYPTTPPCQSSIATRLGRPPKLPTGSLQRQRPVIVTWYLGDKVPPSRPDGGCSSIVIVQSEADGRHPATRLLFAQEQTTNGKQMLNPRTSKGTVSAEGRSIDPLVTHASGASTVPRPARRAVRSGVGRVSWFQRQTVALISSSNVKQQGKGF
jgi:hypothetical protein